MSLPGLAPAALTPVFQEAVHVEVGDQRTDHTSLGNSKLVGFPACHAPRPIPVGGFHRRLEPLLDQPQHVGINDTAGDRLHQLLVWDGVERSLDRLPTITRFQSK